MNPNLYIRYKGIDPDDDGRIHLAELGRSLTGFDSLLRDLAHVLRLNGDLDVTISSPKRGSILVEILACVAETNSAIPFETVRDFLEFLKVANREMHEHAQDFFNSLSDAHRSLNDWAGRNPLDTMAIAALIGLALKKLIEKASKQKEAPDLNDSDLPRRIAEELHQLILKRRFKRPLSPLIQAEVEEIEVATDPTFQDAAKVDAENLSNYLVEDEAILPHLNNGHNYKLEGCVTSLKGTRGDSLTFQMESGRKTYNLDALPSPDKTSKDYKGFYKERVNVFAEVVRKSLFQKPKLKIITMSLRQPELELPGTPVEELGPSDLPKDNGPPSLLPPSTEN